MNLVEEIARIIEPGAFIDGWVDENGTPVAPYDGLAARVALRRAEAERKASQIVTRLSGETGLSLKQGLVDWEVSRWKKMGLPMDDPELKEIVSSKHGVLLGCA